MRAFILSCLLFPFLFAGAYEYDLAIVHFGSPAFAHREDAAVFNLRVKNIGSSPISDFHIQLIHETSILEEVMIPITLFPNEERLYPLVWMIENSQPNDAYLSAQVLQEQDENTANNISTDRLVRIFDEHVCEQYIVSYEHDTTWYPFAFEFANNLAESIYFADELNFQGYIVGLSYLYNFQQTLQDQFLRVFIGNTNSSSLDNNWIPAGNLTSVFDNNYTFSVANHYATLRFSVPFGYGGNNLVIMTNRDYSNEIFSMDNSFYEWLNSTYENRTRAIKSNNMLDPYNPPNEGYLFSRMPSIVFHYENNETARLSGQIVSNLGEPLYGAQIVANDRDTFSNSEGNYLLSRLEYGSYFIQIEKIGYEPFEEAIILDGNDSVLNATLEEIPTVSISGSIFYGDQPTIPVSNEMVYLSGYSELATYTDENGAFNFQSVYINQEYELSIVVAGYQDFEQTILVDNNDLFLEDIFLQEILYPCENILAHSDEEQTVATISWDYGEDKQWQYFELYRLFSNQTDYPEYWHLIATNLGINTYEDFMWEEIENGEYRYAVQAIYSNAMASEPAFSNSINKTNSPINQEAIEPVFDFILAPNPFNPVLKISYNLPSSVENATIEIYNVKGQLLSKSTVDYQSDCFYWDAKNESSGVYLIVLKQTGHRILKKAVLIK